MADSRVVVYPDVDDLLMIQRTPQDGGGGYLIPLSQFVAFLSTFGIGSGGGSGGVGTGSPDTAAEIVVKLETLAGASRLVADAVREGATNLFITSAERSKLLAIAAGATANSADATLLARANHTGTQAESTVTNLVSDLALKAPLAAPAFTGSATAEQLSPVASAMGALAVDVTKTLNTKSVSAASTLTFSATPASGTRFGLRLTSDATARVITIPSSYSVQQNAAITSFTIPASSTIYLAWEYTGSAYNLVGEPMPVASAWVAGNVPTNAISASAIDWALSPSHSKTLAANTTFTFSNAVDGQTINVALTNTASNYTVTWPTVQWAGGAAPTQTVGAKTDVYTFTKVGSVIFGNVSANHS